MGGIVGRHAELAAILERLKAARGRTESTVFIQGEAGVGKSRLLAEALDQARLLGYSVLAGKAEELEQAVPYAPLRDALDAALAAERDVSLLDAVDALQSALSLRPSERSARADRDALQSLYSDGERVLRAWSERQPVVLALDDLHAADRDTITVLSLLARHLIGARLVVMATLRNHAPDQNLELTGFVERLVDAGRATLVDLRPLDTDDIRALTGSLLGGPASDALVRHVWELCRGNPFFAEEALRALDAAGSVHPIDGVWHLDVGAAPAIVSRRVAVLHRIFRLGRPARVTARAASALPEIALQDTALIAGIAGLSELDASVALDDLVRANVLQSSPAKLEWVHPIVRSTLYADLGPAERRRIHAAIARELQARREHDASVTVTAIATHVAECAEHGDTTAAILLADAGVAAANTAPLSAAAWFERAVAILPDNDDRRGPLLARRARALFLAARFEDAADVGKAAVAALPAGSVADRTAALVISALTSCRRFAEALAFADAALAAAARPSARVCTQRATLLQYLNRFDESRLEGERALQFADDDASARSSALGQLAGLAAAEGRVQESVRLLDEQLTVAEALGPVAYLSALVHSSVYLALFGMVDRALVALEQARKLSLELGEAAFRSTLDVAAIITDWLTGQWDAALDRWSLVEASDTESHATPLARCAVVAMLAARGRTTDAATLASRLDDHSSFAASLSTWATATVAVATGRPQIALEQLDGAIASDVAMGRKSALHLLLGLRAEVELAMGNGAAAAATAAHLARIAAEVRSPWSRIAADRVGALVNERADLADSAVRLADEHGLVVEAARGRAALGFLGVEPEVNLRTAHEVLRSLGAEADRSRVAAELRRRGLRVPRTARASHGGTSRSEWQLALLVREGKTNREIARALHLSPKTVEVYLTRLYAKAGVTNRLELALAVADGRIGEPAAE